jgi:hypothetical protein
MVGPSPQCIAAYNQINQTLDKLGITLGRNIGLCLFLIDKLALRLANRVKDRAIS